MKIWLKELLINPIYIAFICIGFVITIYCLSIGISSFNSEFNFYNDYNNYCNQNSQFTFEFKNKISLKEISDQFDKSPLSNKNISFNKKVHMKKRLYSLTGVYNYNGFKSIYPLLSGRYFSIKETTSNDKIALVGANLQDLVYVNNGYKYIKLQDEIFKVVGIIGRKSECYWNITIMVPLKSLPKQIYNDRYKVFTLYYPKQCSNDLEYINKLKNSLNCLNMNDYQISTLKTQNAYSKAFSRNRSIYSTMFFSILLGIISILTFSTFWSSSLKRNIAIKRIVGATNALILKILFFQIFTINLVALFIAFGINFSTSKILSDIFFTNIKMNIKNATLVFTISMLFSFFNSVYVLRDILKFRVLDSLK